MIIKDGILYNIDFSEFNTCVDCVKSNLIARAWTEWIGKSQHVELIYIDIYGQFTSATIGGYKYITYIDDYSRSHHVEFVAENFELILIC